MPRRQRRGGRRGRDGWCVRGSGSEDDGGRGCGRSGKKRRRRGRRVRIGRDQWDLDGQWPGHAQPRWRIARQNGQEHKGQRPDLSGRNPVGRCHFASSHRNNVSKAMDVPCLHSPICYALIFQMQDLRRDRSRLESSYARRPCAWSATPPFRGEPSAECSYAVGCEACLPLIQRKASMPYSSGSQ